MKIELIHIVFLLQGSILANMVIILSQNIERLLSVGSNISLNYKDFPLSSTLERFANIAASSGANLTLRIGKGDVVIQSSLERIALIARGNVTFIFD